LSYKIFKILKSEASEHKLKAGRLLLNDKELCVWLEVMDPRVWRKKATNYMNYLMKDIDKSSFLGPALAEFIKYGEFRLSK